jgi:hypothetical protein
MSTRRPEQDAGPPPSTGRPARIAVSPRVTVAKAERLAKWPGMTLVVEDGRLFLSPANGGASDSARLLAAVPALLDALRMILEDPDYDLLETHREEALAAIAKAEGHA